MSGRSRNYSLGKYATFNLTPGEIVELPSPLFFCPIGKYRFEGFCSELAHFSVGPNRISIDPAFLPFFRRCRPMVRKISRAEVRNYEERVLALVQRADNESAKIELSVSL